MFIRKEKLIQIGLIIVVAVVVIFLFYYLGRREEQATESVPPGQFLESEMQRRARLLLPESQQPLTQEEYERMSGRAEQLFPLSNESKKTEEEKIQIHEALSPKGQ